jgi:N-acetyldiaminopimelate deacetylase
MFWLGVDSPYSLHSEHMAPKEEAIQKGVAAITGFILQRQTEIN